MGKTDFADVLPEMVTFVRVAQLGSFSAAGRLMHMTASGVSKQVTRLEDVLGVQLFRRTTRQLHLTDIGMEVFHKCSELVSAAQGALQVTERFMTRPQGLVRLSAPKAFAKHVLHPAILDFLDKYPDVDVQLQVTDRVVCPIQESVDLVVRLTKEPPLNLVSRPLMQVEHILCASPAFLANNHPIVMPMDLVGIKCLYIGEKDRDNWWIMNRGDEKQTVIVEGRYVANHSEMRLEAIIRGVGLGCVPDFVARKALDEGKVVRVLSEWEVDTNYHGTAQLLWARNKFIAPKCRVLIDHLVAHTKGLRLHAAITTILAPR